MTALAGFAVAETQVAKVLIAQWKVLPCLYQCPERCRQHSCDFPSPTTACSAQYSWFTSNENTNQCLGCHSPEVAPTTGATRVPASHFMDRDGKPTEGTSPRRYFCLQCHVQQTDVNPIIQNKFDTIRQTQSK
ncbi:nitrate reductase cytochrome c-type subunit (NapB) [Actinobacillus equuli]|nr:nitrate reductase cytochrome c-type subunit (NapB) [Actinobacillus equuli]